jgi:predicted 3-demethylubiquinone-9 3-methyltransferase (glyoxalase superfamily)
MDHGFGGDFIFNEAFSFMVLCNNQEEIDYYWEKLSHVPEAEQCGWAKDQFGLSWQIVSSGMDEIMFHGSEDEIKRVTKALLQMKKFDLAALERARRGGESL